MAVLSPSPKLQFFDANGVPLVGGKLYSYAAGTTTPLATYANEGETTFNTNPIILNSRGEAEIWLGTSAYKFKLTTSTDVEIWVVDDISSSAAIEPAIKAYYAASAGSSYVGFIASNGVARTVQAKLRDIVSVQDFGAVGDGVTDDTVAIQNAHDSGARAVYYPATPNGYRITDTIVVTTEAQTIYGDGKHSSYFNIGSQSYDIFEVTAVGNVQIKSLGAVNYGTATSGFFVRAEIPYGLQIIDCYTNNIHSGVLCGTPGSSTGGARTFIINCQFANIATSTGYGIIKTGTSEIFNVIDCVIERPGSIVLANNAAAGILLQGGIAINISNVQLTGVGTPLLIQPNSDNVSHVVLDRVWCDSSSNTGMFIEASGGIVTDIRAVECWFCSCGVDGVRISGVARDVKLEGNNQMTRNVGSGVNVAAGASVFGLSISNNSIGGNLSNGITIGAGATNFVIQNNQIGLGSVFAANANGIVLDAGPTNNYMITNNDLRGNTGLALVNGATGTTARIEGNLGYNPVGVFGITVGASPFTHTAGASPETIFINSGTVSLVEVAGVGVFSQSDCTVSLGPFQTVRVTYSSAPGMARAIL